MNKKNEFNDLAEKIIDDLGGKENIAFFTHCMTRLRFNIKDRAAVKEDEIIQLAGVIGAQWSGEQYQVIIGQNVGDAYQAIINKTGLSGDKKQSQETEQNEATPTKKKFGIGMIFDAFADCISPLLPVLIGSGMLKIVTLVLSLTNAISTESGTYIILDFAGDAGFYFLPVFVGATAARKFGGNMGLGMMLGAMLIHPNFINALVEGELNFLSIPVYNASYTSTIFPTIIAVFVMSQVEKQVVKYSPVAIRAVLEPLVTLLIMIPLTLCLIAPVGAILGVYFSAAVMWLYDTVGFLGVAILAAAWPFMVLTGMHSAITPYLVQSFATLGYEPIALTAIIIANLNQGAAAAAVAVKSKSAAIKSSAATCAITAITAGVTEPAMFGINLRFKKPMIGATIGSFIGAAIAGLGGAYAYSFAASAGIFAFPIYITDNIQNLLWMVAGCSVGMVVTFVINLFVYTEEITPPAPVANSVDEKVLTTQNA
ncbi:PTS system, beta-glucoside (arbutin/salicin/cellobiose)-specific IIB component [Enterococcus sp. DIV2402]|uniref:PTS system, beta-glucoside (Arbutin/salicin/cellobiose)-specific IIB component n=1 Tax=Candidatus Enterococcus lowellii TaxID=2230877 RepID=A0ABZ2SR93_9ENTE|nr:PTS transporter subunit EIIC [Enterococcus sp. DIV2402]MBO0463712.1 PTS transporter subunit EIIC [Enterococcus sp. DIV2402]